MESIAIILFLLGFVAVLLFGVVILFFGISADSAEEFPAHNKRWPKFLLATGLLFIACGWPFILSNNPASLVFTSAFIFASIYFYIRGVRVNT